MSLFTQKPSKAGLVAKDITLMALMVAIIEVSKIALDVIPNVELVSFWIILFTLYWGKRIFYVIIVFVLIEGARFGVELWWITYFYAWPLLAIITLLLKRMKDAWGWSIVSGLFGLSFGALSAIPYVVTGGVYAGFVYWVRGIPYDLIHAVGNFAIMLVLYQPIRRVMAKAKSIGFGSE